MAAVMRLCFRLVIPAQPGQNVVDDNGVLVVDNNGVQVVAS